MADNPKGGNILVAAIDFGTTFSGYAYQFKSSYDQERTKEILINNKWEGDQQLSSKTVTSILFDKDQNFDSFGYLAEKNYSKLALRKKHNDCYFFKKFKMKLHGEKITRNTKIKAANGKEMKAMVVFSESIKYLKNHLLGQLRDRDTQVDSDHIHWILTVPAIWSDSAKQFMREAANQAGIADAKLTIALEPEAASLFCQVLTEEQVSKQQVRGETNIAKTGTEFMVIDLGGGTADITIHRREANGGLTELLPPSGGYFGGTRVDQAFESLITGLVGGPIFKKFCEKDPYDYFSLMTGFERSKRTFTSTTDEIVVTVPIKLGKYYEEENQEEIENAIENSRFKGKVEWIEDKLILTADIMTEIFNECAGNLKEHVKKLMEKDEAKSIKIFLMVGGFSESNIMQNAIKDNFPGIKVIIPQDTGLAVVKGAVLYGQNPTSFTSRMAKYTYGINISPPFDPESHPESHRVKVGNVDRCRDVFKVYIKKGELVKRGDPRKGKHISLKPDQDEMLLKVFVSSKTNPKLVDEEGCECAGNLVVKLPKVGEKVKVEVKMMFGDTELMVQAEEMHTNKDFVAYFDFL